MPHWFYFLTPFGWFNLFLWFITFVHELGHLVVGLLVGHRVTQFRVGLGKPRVQFSVRGVSFEFALDSGGGCVHVADAVRVSVVGVFLTAIAGPAAVFLLAGGILFLCALFFGGNYEQGTIEWFCQMVLLLLVCVTGGAGCSAIGRDIKNVCAALRDDRAH